MQSLNSVWAVCLFFFLLSLNQRGLKAWYRETEVQGRAALTSRSRWRNLWRKAGWKSRGPSWRTGNHATLCSEGTSWHTTKMTEREPYRWETWADLIYSQIFCFDKFNDKLLRSILSSSEEELSEILAQFSWSLQMLERRSWEACYRKVLLLLRCNQKQQQMVQSLIQKR